MEDNNELVELRRQVRTLMAQNAAICRTTRGYDPGTYQQLLPQFLKLKHDELDRAYAEQMKLAETDQHRWNILDKLIPLILERCKKETQYRQADDLLPTWRQKTTRQLTAMVKTARKKNDDECNRVSLIEKLLAELENGKALDTRLARVQDKIKLHETKLKKLLSSGEITP